MGLPVLLSVLAEDRDDLELLKGALEVLQLSVALPQGGAIQQLQELGEVRCPVYLAHWPSIRCGSAEGDQQLIGDFLTPISCDGLHLVAEGVRHLGHGLRAAQASLEAAALSQPACM
jgi:hypothetical protein